MLTLALPLLLGVVLAASGPPCTQIPVRLLDPLDSGKVHIGDVFRFRTIDTIVAPGNISLPRNAVGYGIITFAAAAGPHGKAGSLIIEARYIEIAPHRKFQVAIDSTATSLQQSGASGNAPSAAGALPIPFAGAAIGAFNYLHSGKNAVLPADTRFVVVPADDLAQGAGCTF